MKKVLRLLTLAAAVAGAVWYARQHGDPVPAEGEWKARPPELEAVPEPTAAPRSTSDDLTKIRGIGPVSAERLEAIGITTFAALAAADPAIVGAPFDSRADVPDWIAQAEQLKS